jgi:hypothetical protein
MRPERLEIKYAMQEKHPAQGLRKEYCRCYTHNHQPPPASNVSCRIGKDAGRAKETPCRKWSSKVCTFLRITMQK